MSISPDPGGSLPREESPRFESGYTAPPQPAPSAGPLAGNWFPPVVIVVQVLMIGGLFLLYRDLSDTRQTLQLQLVELKSQQETVRHRLESADEKAASLGKELSDTKQTAQTLGKRLGSTERQVSETKKTAKELEAEQKQAAAQLASQISNVRDEASGKLNAINTDVGGVKKDVDATRKDLEATKASLKSAIGDLGVQSGLIARNHDELTELKRRGERNYFEFNLAKEKTPKRIGDISVRLTHTDQKKGRYTLEVVAEDKKVEKKDKTINEPVQFYVARARIPYEIVVNQVDKDRIVGYLATPK